MPRQQSSAPSGGTLASVFTAFDNFTFGELLAAYAPFALSPVGNPKARPARAVAVQPVYGPGHGPEAGPADHVHRRHHGHGHCRAQLGAAQDSAVAAGPVLRPELRLQRVHEATELVPRHGYPPGLQPGWCPARHAAALRALVKRFVYQPGQGPTGRRPRRTTSSTAPSATPTSTTRPRSSPSAAPTTRAACMSVRRHSCATPPHRALGRAVLTRDGDGQ